jgi:hypothetical protein
VPESLTLAIDLVTDRAMEPWYHLSIA